ncbi:MAG: hypothetical protein E5299_01837 [Burkholderia gladioli]|nr:MAG: hypothetical protein E5299_01837 [Burkholderia gladioli]
MASTGIILGDTNGLRTSEVCNPFHFVLPLDLCNNAPRAVAEQKTLGVELPILRDSEPEPSGCQPYRSEGLWQR